jgi:hypothetical protein
MLVLAKQGYLFTTGASVPHVRLKRVINKLAY